MKQTVEPAVEQTIPVSRILRVLPGEFAQVLAWRRFGEDFRVYYDDTAIIHVTQDKKYRGLYGFSDDLLQHGAYVVSNGETRIITVGSLLVFEIVHSRKYECGGMMWLARYIGMVS